MINTAARSILRSSQRRLMSDQSKICTTFITAPQKYSFSKAWLSDPATYPLLVCLGGAGAFCGGFMAYLLVSNPDIQISPSRRNSIMRYCQGFITRTVVSKAFEYLDHVEETLDRIKDHPGVEGFVICNSDGLVLRRMSSLSQEQAEKIAKNMLIVTSRATCLIRDTNPTDDLRHVRIRMKQKEMLVTHNKDFIIVVIQQWAPYIE